MLGKNFGGEKKLVGKKLVSQKLVGKNLVGKKIWWGKKIGGEKIIKIDGENGETPFRNRV